MGMYCSLLALFPLQWKGYRYSLADSDIPRILPDKFSAVSRSSVIVSAWKEECKRKNPSIWRMLCKLYCPEIVLGFFWATVFGCLNCLFRPWLLRALVEDSDDVSTSTRHAILICTSLFLEAQAYVLNKYELGDRLGCGLLCSLSVLVHRKSLKLSPGTSGDVNERALMAADVMPAYESWKILYQFPVACIGFFFGVALLIITIGTVGLLGSSIVLLLILLNYGLGQWAKRFELKRLNHTSTRLGVTTRTLDAIKAVKFCGWEDRFLKDIIRARDAECKDLKSFRTVQFVGAQVGRVGPVICAAITFMVLKVASLPFDAGIAYAALTVFQSMRIALIMVPMCIGFLISLNTSLLRVKRYLLLPEFESLSKPSEQDAEKFAIQVNNVSFCWPVIAAKESDRRFMLANIDLKLHWGQRVACVGKVGAGKSSLLNALLGQLQGCDGPLEGRLLVNFDSVGVVTQRAFVVSATLQENVVFGRPWDPELFAAVTHAATMDIDLAQLPGGAAAEIGERGVTLSGGQQARVGLARALYGKPRLLVLDDPLAAVDGTVAHQIFQRAILGSKVAPTGRTVLMALNQFRFLRHFDHAILLEAGAVKEQGPPKQLLDAGGAFATFVGSGFDEQDDDDASAQPSDQKAPTISPEMAQSRNSVLINKEKRESRHVKAKTYVRYISGMGAHRVILCLVIGVCTYCSYAFCDQWLVIWLEGRKEDEDRDYMYAAVYMAGTVVFTVLEIARGLAVAKACVATSKAVHNMCITHLLGAPVSFFEETPSGRLISRFGADIGVVDGMLAMLTEGMFSIFMNMLILLVVICVTSPPMLGVVFLAVSLYILQVSVQDSTNTDVKRITNNALSPVLGCLGELSEPHGKLIVRVMGFGSQYCKRFDALFDEMNTGTYVGLGLVGSTIYVSYFLCLLISSCTVAFLLVVTEATPARLGLALTYSFLLPYFFQMFAQACVFFSVCITSLERLLQSSGDDVPQEPPRVLPTDGPLLKTWPQKGHVIFDNVSLIYRPGLPPALHSCSFEIPGGAKVGIVGRTGAGKSSLFVVLFRLVDPSEGRITVDGASTAELGLSTLRSAMAIIPQEPLLFEGTVCTNVDPLNEHPPERLLQELKRVGLEGRELDEPRQMSAGEKQLLQLGRTLLRGVCLVVMDEPTSNIDPGTDAAVQQVVREAFKDCTVMTVAHRLDTVIDSDQIFVMDAGKVAEGGSPAELLNRPKGLLQQMVDGQGHIRSSQLRARASVNVPTETI